MTEEGADVEMARLEFHESLARQIKKLDEEADSTRLFDIKMELVDVRHAIEAKGGWDAMGEWERAHYREETVFRREVTKLLSYIFICAGLSTMMLFFISLKFME